MMLIANPLFFDVSMPDYLQGVAGFQDFLDQFWPIEFIQRVGYIQPGCAELQQFLLRFFLQSFGRSISGCWTGLFLSYILQSRPKTHIRSRGNRIFRLCLGRATLHEGKNATACKTSCPLDLYRRQIRVWTVKGSDETHRAGSSRHQGCPVPSKVRNRQAEIPSYRVQHNLRRVFRDGSEMAKTHT